MTKVENSGSQDGVERKAKGGDEEKHLQLQRIIRQYSVLLGWLLWSKICPG